MNPENHQNPHAKAQSKYLSEENIHYGSTLSGIYVHKNK